MNNKYAVIDIGSNTMRLTIYLHDQNGNVTKLENIKITSRLRSYLSNDNILNQDGINRLLQTLKNFRNVTRYYQLEEVVCVATATLRHAKNQQSVLRVVNQQTDFTIRILNAYEEAYYGYKAVVNPLPYPNGLTIDVGGGSTEVTYFENRQLIHYHSFSFGALSFKQHFIDREKVQSEDILAMDLFVRTQLHSLEWLKKRNVPIIGIGSNVHNVVRVHQAKNNNPLKGLHGCKLSADDIQEVFNYLQLFIFTDLRHIKGLSKKRANIILPALRVLQYLMEAATSKHFILSRKGLRDGILYQILNQDVI